MLWTVIFNNIHFNNSGNIQSNFADVNTKHKHRKLKKNHLFKISFKKSNIDIYKLITSFAKIPYYIVSLYN